MINYKYTRPNPTLCSERVWRVTRCLRGRCVTFGMYGDMQSFERVVGEFGVWKFADVPFVCVGHGGKSVRDMRPFRTDAAGRGK